MFNQIYTQLTTAPESFLMGLCAGVVTIALCHALGTYLGHRREMRRRLERKKMRAEWEKLEQ